MFKKKSLGQHFLQSPAYLRAIVDAAEVTTGDTILEVGPGEGALTRELLSRGARVFAIEKDHRLIPILTATFDREVYGKQLTLIEADALEFEVPLCSDFPPGKEYKVVANIPYYITGALLRKFLSSETQPTTLVFLTQKEVAERIARSKKESLLSLSVKAYGTPQYIKTVPRGAFAPPPTVDSAILRVEHISRKNFQNKEMEDRFFTLIHAGFAQKRKLLARNLESVLGKNAPLYMQEASIPSKARAEDVSLKEWLCLSRVSITQSV